MRLLSLTLATVAALSLAACFVTKTPLITASNAAFPFAGGTAFKSFSVREEDGGWEPSGSGTLLRNGDHYTLHPDPEEGRQPDPTDDVDFRLSDIGGGYYAAEAEDKEDNQILLDVIKVDGGDVYQYVLMCGPEDKKLADDGVIAKYEHAEFSDTCTVSSIDQLNKAFHTKLDAGLQPHGKYTAAH